MYHLSNSDAEEEMKISSYIDDAADEDINADNLLTPSHGEPVKKSWSKMQLI